VTADENFAIYADGEHLADLPAKLGVLPRALKVIAPPGPFAGPPS
jgi:diacylglycerol kinase family enzyme